MLVTGHDYMARVTHGQQKRRFLRRFARQRDRDEGEINPAQDSGRLLAWLILGLSLGIAFLVARIAGWM